ncbi:methyltransferase domain-containing protein [uncultured Thiothrix sp.]|uniref:methyltransferase domain-containing protein n=1 Tax=uncultured Thiothrix sp. TaxID=223185 RepID=UPI00261B8770|nr:methyltransferase domain-containing protein [uncultured Thiothrix sp.]HMT94939.1 methyltransferase domain-containing protein [Thiolinea sp.]
MTTNATALIDCRPLTEYQLGHTVGACSLPAQELFARLHELPKRSQPLQLCGKSEDLRLARAFLLERGYKLLDDLVWTEHLVEHLQTTGQWEVGLQSKQWWQAAPLLQRFVQEFMPRYQIPMGRGLDLACGAGRDLIYLAQHGWQMTGVDWSADSLQRVQQLAMSQNLKITTILRDLETEIKPLPEFSSGSFELICVARYLHRPLFPLLPELLKPSGIIIYQTFMQGCEQTAIGRPRNPKFLLAPHELAEQFQGFELLLDEIEILEDGRPVSAFIARKPWV